MRRGDVGVDGVEQDRGRVVQVPEAMVKRTFAITENNYTGKGFGELEWLAAVRKLEREHGVGYAL